MTLCLYSLFPSFLAPELPEVLASIFRTSCILSQKKNFFLIGHLIQKLPFHPKRTLLNFYQKILRLRDQ